jgi:hypothetical protein
MGEGKMADTPVIHIGENSPEFVALKLYFEVARTEQVESAYSSGRKPDRKWILDTYAECLNAVQNPNFRVPLE